VLYSETVKGYINLESKLSTQAASREIERDDFLTNEHIQQVLDMKTCIEAMEDAYRELSAQRVGACAG
jgi:hypothetical protein